MSALKYLLKKEFLQIRRNKFMARMILIVPIVQMLVLVPAVTLDVKQINMCVVDLDLSPTSRALTTKLAGSTFFQIQSAEFSIKNAEKQLHAGDVDLILSIPNNFERDLLREDQAKIQLLINGINNAFAQTAMAYSRGVIADFNREIIIQNLAVKPVGIVPHIKARTRFWYNPELNYKIYMAPGILAILITVIGFLLSGLNLVREKEMGTSEQINVTPVKKHEFLLGKMVPFLVVGIIDLAFGLLLARLVYAMPIEGNIFVLLLSTVVYLIAIMGLGLLLSTFANTQQQYLFVCFFFQLVFVLMSGIFTPADSMPDWAQTINLANPSAYFIRILRMLLLKGAGLRDLSPDLLSLGVIAVVTTIAASKKYKKIN